MILHVALPAGIVAPQLLVSAKSPVASMLVTFSGELPGLIKVTVCGLLTTFSVWLPKLIACGVNATAGKSPGATLVMKALVVEALPANVP